MTRLAALVALVFAAAPAVAQPFPAPGTGVFTWERVGDRPLDIESFSFAPGGHLVGASPTDSIYAFDAGLAGPPAGRWRTLSRRGVADAVLALDADTLFVGNGNGGLLSRSTDGGRTWSDVNVLSSPEDAAAPNTPAGFSVVPPGHPHAGRLLAGGAVIYSDDRGATWLDADRGTFPGEPGFAHVFATLPSGRLLMAGNWGIAASPDGGERYAVTPIWGDYLFQVDGLAALATPGSKQASTPSCGIADTALCDGAVAVGLDATAPDMRAWRTNDGGRTWSAPVPLPEPYDGVGNGYTAGVVAVGTGADGLGRAITVLGRGVVYATADGGQTWQTVGRMPLDLSLGVHWPQLVRLGPDGHLWVSTIINGPEAEWMYRSAEPGSAAFPVAGEVAPAVSPDVGISVRPNPAGGRVEVVLSLAKAQAVRVVVIDALGREVAVVLDGEAVGERVLGVDTGSWPAGVYVVRATAGTAAASARLVVVR